MKLVCIGDSITSGQYLPPECAWPQRLARLTGIEVLNAGVANETTREGLERFPRHVQDRSPDLLTIQFGLNDCNRWKTDRYLPRVSLEAYRANLSEMVARAFKFDISTIVICGLTPTLKSREHARNRLVYNDAAQWVAAENYVEFFPSPIGNKHLIDDVHLSEIGHRIYAEEVAKCLNLQRRVA